MNIGVNDGPEIDKLRTLSKVLLTAFVLVAFALVYWTAIRGESILARDDNPRLVESELRIQRGTIFDRNLQVLAQNSGPAERQLRIYPQVNAGPAVGFYSLNQGTAGIESNFDGLLRGDLVDPWLSFLAETLHVPQTGRDVRLALDADLQSTAAALLGNYSGAILLLELPNDDARAWVRILGSNPGYDPNLLEEQFEELSEDARAPLLNRATQGQYQPGLLLQPIILASAVEQGTISLEDPIDKLNRAVAVNGTSIQCASVPPEPATWRDVLLHKCPGPMQQLADQMGVGGLDSSFSSFGLDRDPTLEIDTTTTPDEALGDPLAAGIGQDNLSITPLKIGLAFSALARNGKLVQPQLTEAIQDESGQWQPWVNQPESGQVITSSSAQAIVRNLSAFENIREHSVLVLSGPEGSTNAWYVGIKNQGESKLVIVIVLEEATDKNAAEKIGRTILDATGESD